MPVSILVFLKKLLVLLPVSIVALLYFTQGQAGSMHTGTGRLYLFALTIIFLFTWYLVESIFRKQLTLFQIVVQSSFFVYVFMVLTLTGYFILFREVASHDWWGKMLNRIQSRDHVNLSLFKVFKIYKTTDKQILGNLVMMLPLGLYLPLLYRSCRNFLPVFLVSLTASTVIELLQLATRYRSADIDDIFLNVSGACVGFLLYLLIRNAHSGLSTVYPKPETTFISAR